MSDTLLLLSGRIHTLGSDPRPVEALAIRAGRIAAVGSNDEARRAVDSPSRTIDLAGKSVLPSFSDSLGRLHYEAMARIHVDLSRESSIPETFAVVERFAKALPRDNWIVGYGWNKWHWGWKRFPHRADLDLVSPHHPVFLLSSDGRVAWLNSAAIDLLGIGHDTPNPPGGEVERDRATHAATGILKESAVEIFSRHLPTPSPSKLENAFQMVAKEYFRKGVTFVQSHSAAEEFAVLKSLDDRNALNLRVLVHAPGAMLESFLKEGWKSGRRFNRLEMGGSWLAIDGTLASQTAWMTEPYVDDWNNLGVQRVGKDDLETWVEKWSQWEVPPVLHASGDAACRLSLGVFSELCGRSERLRPLLVNGDLLSPGDLASVLESGVDVAVNPRRIESEHDVGFHYLGKRWNRGLELKGWVRNGARLQFGSGEPLSRWSPLVALQVAVAATAGREPLTLEEALRAACRRWSPLEGASDPRLSPGEPADLVILSEDPAEVPKERIGGIEVLATVLDGEVVYEKEETLQA